MTKTIKTTLALMLWAAACGPARAEKADSTKPTVIEANSGGGNLVKQGGTLMGDVSLVRGTLVLKAGRANVTRDPEDYVFATFFALPGALATFRQKRDGGDLWVEGEAERIEYDGKREVVKLYSKAKLRQLEGVKVTQEFEGAYFSYDSRTEDFALENNVSGESKPGGGRVKITLQQGSKAATPPAAGVKK